MDNTPSKMTNYWEYVKSNKEEVLVYLLLIIGILSLFFNPYFGELILGILTGLYFYSELVYLIQNARDMYRDKGRIRYIILMGLTLSLLIFLPVYVITTIVVAAIRQMFAKG